MAEPEPIPDPVLDALPDRWLSALGRGEALRPEDVLAAHPERRAEILALLHATQAAVVVRPPQVPGVPGFDVLRELGRGGNGTVWLARQRGLGRLCALKVLHPAASGKAKARLLAEAQALARLQHPNVVAVFEVVQAGDSCAFAMECVETSLARRLEASPSGLPVPDTCAIGITIARALAAVHATGLVHRDVKPSNILLRQDGSPVLADFGLVHAEDLSLTRTGQFVGTTLYAAPEQLRGEPVTPAADVYALGATLWHACTGHPPFRDLAGGQRLARAEAGAIPPLGRQFPRDLDTILRHCLAPEPARRYANAEALAADLERLVSLRPILARRPSPWTRLRLLIARHRARTAAIVGAVLLMAVVATFAWREAAFRAELPGRLARLLIEARTALLEPGHEQRVEFRAQERSPVPSTRFEQGAAAALRTYDDLLALAPERDDVRLERETVALARSAAGTPSALMMRSAPATAAAIRAAQPGGEVDAATSLGDRRLLGLWAFLRGDAAWCHRAWHGLDLRGSGEADPLVDAATGQLLHENGDWAAALPRLVRAFDTFQAGFLAVAIADCAVETGDAALAEHWLDHAEAAGLRDPWQRDRAVRAAILWSRGERVAAAAMLREVFAAQGSPSMARRLVRWLVAEERFADALAVGGGLVSARDAPLVATAGERWWQSLSLRQRSTAVREASRNPRAPLRIAAAAVERRETSPPSSRNPSWGSSPISPVGDPIEEPRPMVDRDAAAVSPSPVLTPLSQCHCLRDELAVLATPRPRRVTNTRAIVGAWLVDEYGGPMRLARSGALASGLLVAMALMVMESNAPAQTDWLQLAPTLSPPPTNVPALVYDTNRQRVVMFGGQDQLGNSLDTTWEFQANTWSSVLLAPRPSPRRSLAIAFDPIRNRTVLFGGFSDSSAAVLGETWEYDGQWQLRSPAVSPSPRSHARLAYDRSRNVMVLFGGWNGTAELDQTWEYDGMNWVQRNPTNRPSPRQVWGLAYHAATQRVVLFGGFQSPTTYLADTWEWDGSDWLQRTPATSPPARANHALVADERRGRLVLFGGGSGITLSDSWEWDGTNWLLRAPTVNPGGRTDFGMTYDAALGRVVLFGGTSFPTWLGDTWTYGPTNPANFTTFGTACAGTAGTPALTCPDLPWLGDTLRVDVAPIPVVALPFFVIGFSNTFSAFGPLPVNLTILGLTNCFLNVSLDVFELVPNLGGTARWSLAIPSTTSLLGAQLHLQGGTSDLLANPFGAVLSGGATVTVGAR